MTNSQTLVIVATLSFVSLVGISQCDTDHFFVEGQVYCDTCRAEFITRVTEYLEGAKVRLERRNITGGELSYTANAVTDKQGRYSIAVDGDYETITVKFCLRRALRRTALRSLPTLTPGWPQRSPLHQQRRHGPHSQCKSSWIHDQKASPGVS
ncbi:hypothetical protein Droror1_Dr00010292 [Drosera rotundifolia]